jgi:oligopeptide transport system permease protein
MRRFLLSRFAQSIATLFVIVTVVFFLVRVAPGGPFRSERAVSPHIRAQLLASAGLDKPLIVQYGHYLDRVVLHGDLGLTTKYEGRSVGEIIRSAFPISLQLGLTALVIALLIGVPVGVVAAVKRNSPLDYAPMSLAMIGICLPTFVMGPILALLLGIKFNLFNVAGWYDRTDWVLPSLTLGLYYSAYLARLTRAGVLEVLSSDFIRTARAKGVPGTAVVWRHSLKVGLTPVVAYLGPALAGMVTGSFVVETVFQIPGLGQHFIAAARNGDYTLLQGVTVFYAALLIGANIVVDLIQAWMNPRIRLHEA